MESCLVTVIIPMYNVEQYIRRCIDSVISQTYKNIEVLLIDDGSIDNTGSIAEEYAEKYSFVRVIHKCNEGIGRTRNLGIQLAKGEYILFVDSDDYIENLMLEKMYMAVKNHNADIVCCNKYRVFEKESLGMDTVLGLEKEIEMTSKDALRVFLLTKYVDVVFWNKLIKKEIFNGIECPNHIYEDVSVVYQLILNAKKIVCINDPLYYYCQRQSSITDEKFNQKMKLLKEAVDENVEQISNRFPDITNELNLGKIHWYMVILNKMIISNEIDYSFVKQIEDILKENINFIRSTELLESSRKAQYLLLAVSSRLYILAYRCFYKVKR